MYDCTPSSSQDKSNGSSNCQPRQDMGKRSKHHSNCAKHLTDANKAYKGGRERRDPLERFGKRLKWLEGFHETNHEKNDSNEDLHNPEDDVHVSPLIEYFLKDVAFDAIWPREREESKRP